MAPSVSVFGNKALRITRPPLPKVTTNFPYIQALWINNFSHSPYVDNLRYPQPNVLIYRGLARFTNVNWLFTNVDNLCIKILSK